MTVDIQSELATIRAALAEADAQEAAALSADASRCSSLDAAKARCADECGEVSAALAEATDPRERAALIELEARVHAAHADELGAAYKEFSGQRDEDSNPAPPGNTEMSAAVVVDLGAGA